MGAVRQRAEFIMPRLVPMTCDPWNQWCDERLDQALAKVAILQQYRDWIVANLRAALGIRPESEGADAAGVLGGHGADPEQYQPVITLDLAAVRTMIEALPPGHDLPAAPASGLLKLTVSPDEAELEPNDPERIRASFEPDVHLGDRAEDPKDSIRCTLTPILTLPPEPLAPSRPAKDDLFEDWNELEHLLAAGTSDQPILGHLFGWPRWNTLAYDPRPDATWLTLLGLMSDEPNNLYFGDGDWLMVFIEPDALAGADFGHLATDEG